MWAMSKVQVQNEGHHNDGQCQFKLDFRIQVQDHDGIRVSE